MILQIRQKARQIRVRLNVWKQALSYFHLKKIRIAVGKEFQVVTLPKEKFFEAMGSRARAILFVQKRIQNQLMGISDLRPDGAPPDIQSTLAKIKSDEPFSFLGLLNTEMKNHLIVDLSLNPLLIVDGKWEFENRGTKKNNRSNYVTSKSLKCSNFTNIDRLYMLMNFPTVISVNAYNSPRVNEIYANLTADLDEVNPARPAAPFQCAIEIVNLRNSTESDEKETPNANKWALARADAHHAINKLREVNSEIFRPSSNAQDDPTSNSKKFSTEAFFEHFLRVCVFHETVHKQMCMFVTSRSLVVDRALSRSPRRNTTNSSRSMAIG